MKVKDIMTKDVEVIAATASVKEAAEKMKRIDVGSLPIVEGTHMIGILTDRDIVLRSDAAGHDPNEVTVKEIMSSDLMAIFADQDVDEAAKVMADKQIRRLPVLDREMQLIGIVTLGDISEESKQKDMIGETLEKISKPSQPKR